MRVLGGQVHVGELTLVIGLSARCFLVGTSLPLVAGIALLLWPLMLMQLLLDGLGIWIGTKIFRRRTKGHPPRAKRHGVARFLWVLPFSALTLGYALYVLQTGRWLL